MRDQYRAAMKVVAKTMPDMSIRDAMRLADAFAPIIKCTHPANAIEYPADGVAVCGSCGDGVPAVELIDRHENVTSALAADKFIAAIKELRIVTGWGLAESKRAVDSWRAERCPQ